jgi:hypothetical protein
MLAGEVIRAAVCLGRRPPTNAMLAGEVIRAAVCIGRRGGNH